MPEDSVAPLPPAGWYPDPGGSSRERYWTGVGWAQSMRDTPPVAVAETLQVPERGVSGAGLPLIGFESIRTIGVSVAMKDLVTVTVDNEYRQSGYALREDGAILRWWSRTALVSPTQGNSFEHVRFVVEVVEGLGRAVELVSAGKCTHLALLDDGTVWEWTTEFADGNVDAYIAGPRRVTGLEDVRTVRTPGLGANWRFALDGDGRLWSWGSGYLGQLGLGDEEDRLVPELVPGLGRTVDLRFGASVVTALTADGAVWTWGRSSDLTLGDGEGYAEGERLAPAQVQGLPPVVALGDFETAVDGTGTAWGWYEAQAARRIEGLGAVRRIHADHRGWTRTSYFAVGRSGELWAWGENSRGQLGDGTTADPPEPVRVSIPGEVVEVAAEDSVVYALTADGRLFGWGGIGYRDSLGAMPTEIELPALQDAPTFQRWWSLDPTWLGSPALRQLPWDLRDGRTMLMMLSGASEPMEDEIELMLTHGSDVNARDDDGDSALYYAASRGNADVVDLLLSHGANADLPPAVHGETALVFAALACLPTGTPRAPGRSARDYRRIVISLLRAGADPGPMYDRNISLVRYSERGMLRIQRQHVASYLHHDDLELVLITSTARW